MADYPGPLTPEEIDARSVAYFGGQPAAPAGPAVDPAYTAWRPDAAMTPAAPVEAPVPGYFGGPAPTGPAPIVEDPNALVSTGVSKPEPLALRGTPGVDMSVPSVRQPVAFERETPKPAKKAAPAASSGPAAPNALAKAEKAYAGSYDALKANEREVGAIQGRRADTIATGSAELSRMQQEAAQDNEREVNEANEGFDRDMSAARAQIDAVRVRQIDPARLLRGEGMAAAAIVGGVLGGIYQGLNKMTSNPFMDDLHRQIDRDIRAQEKDIDTSEKGAINRLNLVRENRAMFKDHNIARLQAKNTFFEAYKNSFLAEAANNDAPLARAQSEQAALRIESEQKKLEMEIEKAVQQRNAAAAAAKRAELEHLRKAALEERAMKVQEGQLGVNQGKLIVDAAEADAKKGGDASKRFVATGQDENGNPTGYVARSDDAANKAEEARTAHQELLAEIDNALKIRQEAGVLGRTLNRNDPTDTVQLYTPEWQTKIRQSAATLQAKWNKAQHLGTMDAGTKPLLDAVVGNLESRFGESDDRLRALREQAERSVTADEKAAAGQRVAKVIGEDGSVKIVPVGGANAPANTQRVTRRAP